MREFFKGWRRKTGCLTLVTALMVFSVWGRTRFYRDDVVIAFSKHIAVAVVASSRGMRLEWRWQSEQGFLHRGGPGMEFYEVMFDDSKTFDWKKTPFVDASDPFADLQWSWRIGGIGFGGSESGPIGSRQLIVSYWPTILALTLVSAWLLLFKRTAQPTPAN